MAVRNISDLALDEIDEDFLREQAVGMGDDLGVDTGQGSLYMDAAEGHIIRAAKFFHDLRSVSEIISINTCTGEVLDEKLKERGMKRNPAEDTPAVYYVLFSGAEPEKGDLMSCGDHFFTAEKIGDRWAIRSEETGTEMNHLTPGLPVVPEQDVDNLVSATLQELAVPAVDAEDDESARQRLLSKLAEPDENGNRSQIRSWCESINGVGRARIIPQWDGPMTVKGIIIGYDGGVPTKAVVDAVQSYIDPDGDGMGEGMAAIGQIFTAEGAEAVEINVSVTIIKSAEASYADIREAIQASIRDYCKSIALEGYSEDIQVRYNRISAMITETEHVVDHESLLLNGGTENIAFEENQIPVLGEVVLNGNIL